MKRSENALSLRRADGGDKELVFSWRNDPSVRRNSFHTEEIPWEMHSSWYDRMLADPARRLFILEDAGVPVGQVRLDREGEEAEISYLIAPGKQGMGYGTELIRMVQAQAPGLVSGMLSGKGGGPVRVLTAQVRKENGASRRIFEKLGFASAGEGESLLYRYEF